MLQSVRESGEGFSGEILAGTSGTDVVPPLGGIILPKGRRGYPSSAFLEVPGEILGPVHWSGQQRMLSFLKVLLGTRRFGARSVVVLLRRAQRSRVTVV